MTLRFEENDKKYWDWLKDKKNDAGQIKFKKKLIEIRNAVRTLYMQHEQYEPPMPYFTPHGIEHLKAVEDNIHLLIHKNNHKKLTKAEKYFLLGSAWLHDTGMLQNILPDDHNAKDYKEIRDTHHYRSQRFITEHWSSCGIEEHEAPCFSLLALFHRRRKPIEELKETIETKYGTIRVKLIAAYLRLADALHIDITRAPASAYAICLSYNIPFDSKLHWIKSKFVLAVDVDPERHQIIINLREPLLSGIKGEGEIKESIQAIHKMIMKDFADELNGIKEILVQEGITYFLKVKSIVHKIESDRQLMIDIKGLLANYDVLSNPTGTSMTGLILDTINNIITPPYDYSHAYDKDSLCDQYIDNSTKQSLTNFINEVKRNNAYTTECNYGLKNIMNQITNYDIDNDIKLIHATVKKQISMLRDGRKAIRCQAKDYFSKEIISISDNSGNNLLETIQLDNNGFRKEMIKPFNILMFGYSGVVIKSLCGFRDAIIDLLMSVYLKNEKSIPACKMEFEKTASVFFRIFICETQTKTQITHNGELIYNEGIKYARKIREYGFSDIVIIPDSIAGTLIVGSHNLPAAEAQDANGLHVSQIHFIMLGANGYNDNIFYNTAGTSMIVKLANMIKHNGNLFPKVVLSALTYKYIDGKEEKQEETKKRIPENEWGFLRNDGLLFRKHYSDELVREKLFIPLDDETRNILFKSEISFYNPREEKINMNNYVDVVLHENGYRCITQK